MQYKQWAHALSMTCVNRLGNICIILNQEVSAKACALRARDVCQKAGNISQDLHTSALTCAHLQGDICIHQQQEMSAIFKVLKGRDIGNIKWYRLGYIGRELPHQSYLLHRINQCYTWSVHIGCGLCTPLRSPQSLTFLIAFGVHKMTYRHQMGATLIGRRLHTTQPTSAIDFPTLS